MCKEATCFTSLVIPAKYMAFKIKYLKWNKESLVLFLDIRVSHRWFHKPNRDKLCGKFH